MTIQDTQGYIYENVGPSLAPSQASQGYIYENVGASLAPSQASQGYIYENVVTDDVQLTSSHWGIRMFKP